MPAPDRISPANFARLIVGTAELHCTNTGEDHLAGDAQDVIQSLLELLSSEQLSAFASKFINDDDATLNVLFQDSRELRRVIREILIRETLRPPT